MLPSVGPFSTIKLSKPVRIVETDQAGFHVSGWKSVMDKHNLWTKKKMSEKNTKQFSFPKLSSFSAKRGRTPILPGVAFESSVWCYHINTWWFKRKFSRKHEFSVIISP